MPDDELDYEVVVVRYDRDRCCTVVDTGSVDLYTAHSMLKLASLAVFDEIPQAILISDEAPLPDLRERCPAHLIRR